MRSVHTVAVRAGVTWCAVGRIAGAQLPGVGVDPHIVVLTPARPAGQITVFNPRPEPAEFSVDLRFGFATTDSVGAPTVVLRDTGDSASAAEWITPYPRHFTLAPGGTQTVRLLARAPAELTDREYWARLTVHSRPLQLSDPAAGTFVSTPDLHLPGDVTAAAPPRDTAHAALSFETATVLPIFYRKGVTATGVNFEQLSARLDGDSVDVTATLRRIGNAAFIGTARISILAADSSELVSTRRQLAVYTVAAPRWRVAVPGSGEGVPSRVAVTLSTERADVSARLVLHGASVTRNSRIERR